MTGHCHLCPQHTSWIWLVCTWSHHPSPRRALYYALLGDRNLESGQDKTVRNVWNSATPSLESPLCGFWLNQPSTRAAWFWALQHSWSVWGHWSRCSATSLNLHEPVGKIFLRSLAGWAGQRRRWKRRWFPESMKLWLFIFWHHPRKKRLR